MVSEQVGQRPVRADGETRGAREVVFGDNGVLHFIVLTHVDRGHAIDGGLDLLAGGDINKNLFRRYPKLCVTIFVVNVFIPIIDRPVISPKSLGPHHNYDLALLPRLSGL